MLYIIFWSLTVPPKLPVILDENGLESTTHVGPYVEGVTVKLSCEVKGGKYELYIQDINTKTYINANTLFLALDKKSKSCYFFLLYIKTVKRC